MNQVNLSKIKTKNILVIGDIMIDRYYKGNITRISPEAPAPIFLFNEEYDLLGGAANVAANIIAGSSKVSLVSVIGDDYNGNVLKKQLCDKGIQTNLIVVETGRKTTVKIRYLGQNNYQTFRLDIEDKNPIYDITQKKILQNVKENITKFDIVLISDYQKGLLTHTLMEQIINLCDKNNKRLLIDVKSENLKLYENAWLLKPNLSELAFLTKMDINTKAGLENAGKYLREKTKSKYVLVTRGADGMMLVSKEAIEYFDCLSKDVYDVTGAGDTVLSYLGIGISNELSLHDSITLANYAAGVKVSHNSTYAVTLDDIYEYIKDNFDISNKIISIKDIENVLKRHKNKKIVFTNGCFDLFHVGHARYLKQAAQMGDILVIGVNSDKSVKALKGEERPIVNQDERMELLADLTYVNYVVMFDDETPYELIKKVNPFYVVKGGDYNPKDVVGKDIAEANGGGVRIVKYIDGKSSTNIIDKIRKGGDKNENINN